MTSLHPSNTSIKVTRWPSEVMRSEVTHHQHHQHHHVVPPPASLRDVLCPGKLSAESAASDTSHCILSPDELSRGIPKLDADPS